MARVIYCNAMLPRHDTVDRSCRKLREVENVPGQRFDAFLFSGGGNDIACLQLFSFVNHAASHLANPNAEVLHGVVAATFEKAYEDMIDVLEAEAQRENIKLPIFVHGYDYPWPDGRGAVALGIAGPWFGPTFQKKGYPFRYPQSPAFPTIGSSSHNRESIH